MTKILNSKGASCGFLTVMSALAGGADRAYTEEEGISLAGLMVIIIFVL